MVAVIRINKTADYTVMSNSHFREKGLSLKAKGLLSLMLSLPDDWDYSVAGLCTLSTDGKDSISSGLEELEKFGYVFRTRAFDEKGRFAGYNYDIYETPQMEYPFTEKPSTGKPFTEKPSTENPPQYNTNQSNTDISSIKGQKESKRKADSFNRLIADYAQGNADIVELLLEWLKVRKAKRAAMTDRAIQLNLEKLDSLAAESGMTVTEYLKEVICRGWQAFYPIKNYAPKATPQRQSGGIIDDYERMRTEIETGGLFD